MTQSEARRILSELAETLGRDGVLVVPKGEAASAARPGNPSRQPGGPVEAVEEPDEPRDTWEDWEDLVPGKALRWPKCECGSPKCPDYEASRTTVAERDGRRSRRSRGGT